MKPILNVALYGAATLAIVSCSSTVQGPIDENTPGATFQKGVPGGVIVETYKMTATVTGVDAASRKVSLASSDGRKTTVTCGPEIVNFDQIQVGDHVKARVTAEVALAMTDKSTPPSASGGGMVMLAPQGGKPGGLMTETQEYTATIKAINLKRHQATLSFPDGSNRTFAVRKDVDLTQRKVGELVSIRATLAVALSLEKPQ
jgi:hypothetical protein